MKKNLKSAVAAAVVACMPCTTPNTADTWRRCCLRKAARTFVVWAEEDTGSWKGVAVASAAAVELVVVVVVDVVARRWSLQLLKS